eukprot:CAMPEP_0177203890 /NCGR_PEP_ID=MMETSP0367-20130122/28053_1 /TAXON_ID=447022 ORGANISM="Scrippsiella hangoei-like, Strain SHHI-4" /NCGR_SAMPLE_ID=MMETSP0367 /ASSEMBLY_ACC=CAM_ASM_000362 /LENGTH=188 /DNA_ID=CAMNT_0018652545 /DNA_START=306 /DNA_END=872 /DNA_ORIENTATION=-
MASRLVTRRFLPVSRPSASILAVHLAQRPALSYGCVAGDAAASPSYIHRAAQGGRDTLLGPFQSSNRFDSVLRDHMECTSISDGEVVCNVTISEQLQNTYGTLHGGATSTLVDVLGTMALLTKDPKRPGVSVEMSQTFLAPVPGGETVIATGFVVRYGRRLGFTEIRIVDNKGNLLATGRHTKAFPQK